MHVTASFRHRRLPFINLYGPYTLHRHRCLYHQRSNRARTRSNNDGPNARASLRLRGMTTVEQKAVAAIHKRFDELPKKCKPRLTNDHSVAEWVPLSGIALGYGDGEVECVALGTGMKCLPLSKIPTANGSVLHDWHAEALAMRAINLVLLEECLQLASSEMMTELRILKKRDRDGRKQGEDDDAGQPFTIRSEIRILMYCSEAPCGDASMELVMKKQEDATPWSIPEPTGSAQQGLLGRECFSELGVVRRKPARRDSPLTMSKSCSDKIALKQCTSLLSGLSAQLIHPENAYIDTLILPEAQYDAEACERCFGPSGRMRSLMQQSWTGGYSFRPFHIATTSQEFEHSRTRLSQRHKACKGSNLSAVWTRSLCETLINGVLQGRKQDDPKGASRLSRGRMLEAYRKTVEAVTGSDTSTVFPSSYLAAKSFGNKGKARRRAKARAIELGLQGWIANGEDDFFLSP